jgi:hypothetical protein
MNQHGQMLIWLVEMLKWGAKGDVSGTQQIRKIFGELLQYSLNILYSFNKE